MLDWVSSPQSGKFRLAQAEHWLFPGIMVGAVVVAMGWNWPLVDQSHDWSTRERGETMLRELQPNALIFGWWQTVPVIQYLQFVEGQRPDVKAINRFLISPKDMQGLIEQEISRRPIYTDGFPPLLPNIEAEAVGPVYLLQPYDQVIYPTPALDKNQLFIPASR